MEQTQYEESYDETPRPTPPLLWIGLTAFFALCCCFFFVVAGVEAVFLFGGAGAPGTASAPAGKPEFGSTVAFYLAQKSATEPTGTALTTAPAGSKTIYAFFTYKNMPRSGTKWSYEWLLNGEPLSADSKTDIAWTREGSGRFSVRLNRDGGLTAGDYDLVLKLNGSEVASGTVTVDVR